LTAVQLLKNLCNTVVYQCTTRKEAHSRVMLLHLTTGTSMAQAVSRRLLTAADQVQSQSGHVGFEMDEVALARVPSE
jgi:hypothetical protein